MFVFYVTARLHSGYLVNREEEWIYLYRHRLGESVWLVPGTADLNA